MGDIWVGYIPTLKKIEIFQKNCLSPHHHYLFWKRSFRVRCLPIWSLSAYPWILFIQAANQDLSCHLSHIFSTSSYSSPTSHPCNLHLFTGRHTSTFQMPKPPQSATPHHICHTLYTQYRPCTNPRCTFYPSATLHTSYFLYYRKANVAA